MDSLGHRLKTAGSAVLIFLAMVSLPTAARALGDPKYMSDAPSQGDFVLAANGQTATLVVSDQDWPGVMRAVGDLSQDVGRVTGHDAAVMKSGATAKEPLHKSASRDESE